MTRHMRVTVIAPALNEVGSIEQLIDALLGQSRQADEIIIADGGSTDGTRRKLDERSAAEPRLTVVDGPGGISENRNAAIRSAGEGIIACTDAGCVPQPDWLENLCRPFDSGADWVAGISLPAGENQRDVALALALMPAPNEIKPDGFSPGGASQAFTKTAWARIGGFPEGMTAGEDTIFGQRMRAAGFQPVFTPQAAVLWSGPAGFGQTMLKARRWGEADGRSGWGPRQYLKLTVVYWTPLLATVVGVASRWWVIAGLGILALFSMGVLRTHKKMRWVAGIGKWVVLPVAHSGKMLYQTFGWLKGFLEAGSGRSPRAFLRRWARRAASRAKRVVRPFLPDPVMARLRGAAAASRSRTNVTVFVEDPRAARKWLQSLPNTYRVAVLGTAPPEGSGETSVHSIASPDWDGEAPATASWILSRSEVEVVIVAETGPPRIDLGRFNEPALAVRAVAASSEAWATVEASHPDVAASLARQAGLRIGLVPVPSTGRPVGRRDPIRTIGAVVMLGTVPLYDIGGGSRGAQITQELLARGYHVVHTYLFDADESVDLGLRIVHPNLEHMRLEDFDIEAYRSRLQTDDLIAILEIPHPAFLPLVRPLREHGFKIAYDLMDDWSDPALGGWGYAAWAEEGVAVSSDVLIASAPSLVKRLADMTGRHVVEVPNAVNTRLFQPGDFEQPHDIPPGNGPVFEYHGSLYGDWFDWEALKRVADAYPDARLLIIGDEKKHPPMPGNVHFLGLKPQFELPAYLAYTDVALVPFVVSETTHAVSPLKAFEYLAMGVPVAASPLEPLVDLPGVHTDTDLVAAVGAALTGPRPDSESARRLYSWEERLHRLFSAAGMTLREDTETPAVRLLQRPIIRYRSDERLLT